MASGEVVATGCNTWVKSLQLHQPPIPSCLRHRGPRAHRHTTVECKHGQHFRLGFRLPISTQTSNGSVSTGWSGNYTSSSPGNINDNASLARFRADNHPSSTTAFFRSCPSRLTPYHIRPSVIDIDIASFSTPHT